MISKIWKGVGHRYIFLSEHNKYYAINYQWIKKFGFPSNYFITKFNVSEKEILKFLN